MKPFGILLLLSLLLSLSGNAAYSQSPPDAPVPITAVNAGQVTPLVVLGRGTGGQASWSPDGNTLAVAGSLGVWLFDGHDLMTASPRLLETPTAGAYTIAFSPNSRFLAAGLDDSSIVIWDIITGGFIHQDSSSGWTNVLVFSPDGTMLASGHGEYFGGRYWHTQVRLWDAATMTLLAVLEAPVRPVGAVDFSADGRWLAAAGFDESVRIWRVQRVLDAQDESLLEDVILTGNAPIKFNDKDHRLAYAGLDGQLHVWDMESEASVSQLPTAVEFRFSRLDFRGDQVIIQQIAPADESDWLLGREIWHLRSNTSETVSTTLTGSIVSATQRVQDGMIVSLHGDGTLRIWDDQLKLQNSLSPFGKTINNISFGPEGDVLIASTGDYFSGASHFYRWYVPTALNGSFLPERLPDTTRGGRSEFSPDGTRLAIVDMFRPDITLLDMETAQEPTILHAPDDYLTDVAFAPDNTLLASAAASGVVRLWDVATGTERLVLRDHPRQWISTIRFSPDGHWLAVSYFADRHSTLELWDMKENLKTGDGVPYITLAVESENPGELPFAFRTDSKRLALISYDTITLWNLDTQTQQAVIQGVRQVQGLAFNADGSLLAATIDVEARPGIGLWDTETGVQLFALKGHKSRITALAFNRDGTLLASASLDGTVRLWGIPTTH